MIRHSWERFRQIAPDRGRIIAFLVLFVSFEALIHHLESINIPISERLPIRPATALLLLFAASYGVARVTDFHPVFQTDYRAWLEATPWNNTKPLPLGPVELVFEDGLVLGPLLLLSATLPQPRAMSLLCVFLLCHLGAIVVSLWLTRMRLIGYLSAFGLGFAVWQWHQPIACVATAAVVYLIAYEGFVQALDRFPWAPRLLPLASDIFAPLSQREPIGWPHDRMLGDVVAAGGISRIDAILCGALGSWWVYVLASFIRDEANRVGLLAMMSSIVFMAAPLMRLGIYTQGYAPPLSVWGRIRTLRWIIPRNDVVLVGPIAALLAGPATAGLLYACRCPLDACITAGAGVTVIVALIAPPRLRRWRLTGGHRIGHGIVASNQAFIKVG